MAGWTAPALLLLAASRLGMTQSGTTWSKCDPTKRVCPPVPALGTTISVDFANSDNSLGAYVSQVNGPLTFDGGGNGLVLLIMGEKDAPRAGISKYMFYGRVDVAMRTAPGPGIVTSFVLQADDLDEIDFEWVGAASNTTETQTNYFSKGCTSSYDRAQSHTGPRHSEGYHVYSIDWTPEKLDWLIDGVVIRTISAETASKTPCGGFPQSPMRITVGSWVAGNSGNPPGTVEWAGGLADFSGGPLQTYIKAINVTDDANGVKNATQYRHSSMDGRAQSVVVETAENATRTTGNDVGTEVPPSQGSTISSAPPGESSSGLSSGAIMGIIAGFVVAGAIIGGLVLMVFLQRRRKRQRRKSETADVLVKDGGAVGGVDMKQELDGNTLSEMDGAPPEPKELEVKEIKIELNSERDGTEIVSPLSPDLTGDTGGTVASLDEKKQLEEFYELPGDTPTMPRRSGDELERKD
ncbi:concanavalin A-like lectin/glucanase domain-containing protein [Immersiella caudata]|uniref:Concanavalin A-like lectin/glucanase domain-containing protein n=1 Tax=Immersiella caudata TaxID=314043 RepID=A0AA39WM25_9PEZI|nr:concanavalin A-like lectin/glucanase domain-containing protein [Immersiella caudata]